MIENSKRKDLPKIKGIVKRKFDEFFWRRFLENKNPMLTIINADAKVDIGITNQTFINGLSFLAQEGYIKYEYQERKRNTELTLTEKYLKELKGKYELQETNTEVLNRETNRNQGDRFTSNSMDIGPRNRKQLESQHEEQITIPKELVALIPHITSLVFAEIDKNSEGDNKEITELRSQVELLRSMVNALDTLVHASSEVIKDRIRHLENLYYNKN